MTTLKPHGLQDDTVEAIVIPKGAEIESIKPLILPALTSKDLKKTETYPFVYPQGPKDLD